MKLYEYQGEQYTLRQLSEIAPNGATTKVINNRLHQGMTVEKAVTLPVKGAKTYEYQGQWLTIDQIAQLTHYRLSTQMLRYRLNKKHMTVEDAISTKMLKAPKSTVAMICGATSPYDCLNCPHDDMPCLKYGKIMAGEGATDYVFTDYGKR